MKAFKPRRELRATVLASAIASLLGVSSAYAQQQEEEATARSVEEITVTGTRIRRDDFTTPNATTVVTRQEMDNLGIINVGDMLTQMPGNVSEFTLDNIGDSAFHVGATLPNLRGMNTFFGTRTLTLVDSRRFVSTNNGGGVDLNVIPSAMVGRLETVTGGASASYGADAVSGVVNVILDTDLQGIRIRSDYGQTTYGDGENHSISVAGGTSLLGGRAHLTLSYERQDNKAIEDCASARDWCGKAWGVFNQSSGGGFFGPAPFTPIEGTIYFPGQPGFVFAEGLRRNVHPNGVLHTNIQANTLWYRLNDAGDDLVEFQPGHPHYRTATGTVVGGEGPLETEGLRLRPNRERDSYFGAFKFAINDRIELYSDVSFSSNASVAHQHRPASLSENLCIRPENAFFQQLPEHVQDAFRDRRANGMDTCSIQPFGSGPGYFMSKSWIDQIDRHIITDTESRRAVVGVNADIFNRWNLDAYFQYGNTQRQQFATNYTTVARARMGLDSVIDSNTGQPVCRVHESGVVGNAARATWLNFWDPDFAEEYFNTLAHGCVPINPFGQQASQAALDYYFDDLTEWNHVYQRVLSTSLSGPIAAGWAGDIMMAAGLDYRYDYTRNDAGDTHRIRRTDFSAQYGDPWAGEVEGVEAFVELEVPLMRDRPVAQYMMLNVAARRAEQTARNKDERQLGKYDQTTDSWKASFVWDPVDWMRVRATRSSDVRAPSLRELFYRQTQQQGSAFNSAGVTNPWLEAYNAEHGTNHDTTQQGEWIIGANPNLSNETSTTNTYGLVFTPGGPLQGFRFAVDYFETVLRGGINYLGPQDTIDGCYYENVPEMCAVLEFGGTPVVDGMPESRLIRWESLQVNREPFTSAGYDITTSYNFQLGGGGGMAVRLIGTRMAKQMVNFGVTTPDWRNVAGMTGGNTTFLANFTPTPRWGGNMFVTYFKNAFTITGQALYTGRGALNLTTPWYGPEDPRWAPELNNTVAYNSLPSWTTFNLTTQYDFTRSPIAPGRFEELTLYLRVDNVTNKDPIFSNGRIGGVNATFFPTLGRNYQLGLRMQF